MSNLKGIISQKDNFLKGFKRTKVKIKGDKISELYARDDGTNDG